MTTNQTIDGVPRELLKNAASRLWADGNYNLANELRALLDEPIPFPGYPPVPEDRKLPAVQYREVDGEHCPSPECCAWISPNSECTQCKPSAQPQGEPVADLIRLDRSYRNGLMAGFQFGITGDEKGYAACIARYNAGIHAAKAEQPAPVAVSPICCGSCPGGCTIGNKP